jgi:hypothetical protein
MFSLIGKLPGAGMRFVRTQARLAAKPQARETNLLEGAECGTHKPTPGPICPHVLSGCIFFLLGMLHSTRCRPGVGTETAKTSDTAGTVLDCALVECVSSTWACRFASLGKNTESLRVDNRRKLPKRCSSRQMTASLLRARHTSRTCIRGGGYPGPRTLHPKASGATSSLGRQT